MAYFVPTYDGIPIFGEAVSMQHVPNATQHQIDAFFGVGGQISLFGGSRGRTFLISGVLIATEDVDDPTTIGDLNSFEALILSYADGIARTLTDTRGRAWPFVFFRGEFSPDPMGPKPTDFGWALPYRMVMHGLI
jgi:hypothetical protein